MSSLSLVLGGPAARGESRPTGRQIAFGSAARCPDKVRELPVTAAGQVVGRWLTVRGPTFGVAPGETPRPITAHAVDPRAPQRQFVSDGRAIYRTGDGGCTWSESHFVPEHPNPAVARTGLVQEQVLQLSVSDAGPAPGWVWALVGPVDESIGDLRVLVTEDDGDVWQDRSADLPPMHTKANVVDSPSGVSGVPGGQEAPRRRRTALLALAPGSADVAYLGLTSSVHGNGPFYATEDAGRNWTARDVLPRAVGFGTEITEITVDPGNPSEVWILAGDGTEVMRSTDKGETWTSPLVDEVKTWYPADGLRLVRLGGTLRAQVVSGKRRGVLDSVFTTTNARMWGRAALPHPVGGDLQVSQGGHANEMIWAAASQGEAFRLSGSNSRWPKLQSLAAPGLGRVEAPQPDLTTEPVHWFRQADGIAAFVP